MITYSIVRRLNSSVHIRWGNCLQSSQPLLESDLYLCLLSWFPGMGRGLNGYVKGMRNLRIT